MLVKLTAGEHPIAFGSNGGSISSCSILEGAWSKLGENLPLKIRTWGVHS